MAIKKLLAIIIMINNIFTKEDIKDIKEITKTFNSIIIKFTHYYKQIDFNGNKINEDVKKFLEIFNQQFYQSQLQIRQDLNQYLYNKYNKLLTFRNKNAIDSMISNRDYFNQMEEKDQTIFKEYRSHLNKFYIYFNNILELVIKHFDKITNLVPLYILYIVFLQQLHYTYLLNSNNVDIIIDFLKLSFSVYIGFFYHIGIIGEVEDPEQILLPSEDLLFINNEKRFDELITDINLKRLMDFIAFKKSFYNHELKKQQYVDDILDHNQEILIKNIDNLQILLTLIKNKRKLKQ